MSVSFLVPDSQSIRLEHTLPATPERVWAHLTQPELLPVWLADGSIEARVGANAELSQTRDGPPVRTNARILGVVTRCQAGRVLERTWRHVEPGSDPAEARESLVRFELAAAVSRTVLSIEHSRLSPDARPGVLAGWHAHTAILEARLAGAEPDDFMASFEHLLPGYEQATTASDNARREVEALYRSLLASWDRQDAAAYAAHFASGAQVIGFDGSTMSGPEEIEDTIAAIFANHRTARYLPIVRSLRLLSDDAAVLMAHVGMVPPGGSDINPAVNAVQSLTAVRQCGAWRVACFQNTPAALHGRPEASEALTRELRAALSGS